MVERRDQLTADGKDGDIPLLWFFPAVYMQTEKSMASQVAVQQGERRHYESYGNSTVKVATLVFYILLCVTSIHLFVLIYLFGFTLLHNIL